MNSAGGHQFPKNTRRTGHSSLTKKRGGDGKQLESASGHSANKTYDYAVIKLPKN